MRLALAALVLLTAHGSRLSAQVRDSQSREPRTEAGLQVYLMTFGEGELYWEKYGHNALWFVDPARRIDEAYNWGMFDFEAPGFLRRLLIGDMQYWVSAFPGQELMEAYRRLDRTVILQRLNLTPAQAEKALSYARWNARDENKFYRYDYFRDNCSTRVRDLMDYALDGALKRQMSARKLGRTYRSETLRLVDDLKLTQFGIDAALGPPTDRALSVWESGFAPMRLAQAAREIRIAGDSAQPLIAEERVVYSSQRHTERQDAPRLALPYFVVGLILALALFSVAWAARRAPLVEMVFRAEVAIWALLTGLLGLIILLAWLITDHVFWYRNENLLLFNPLSLFLMALAIMSMRNGRWLRPAAICAAIIAALGAIALLLKAISGSQDNLPLILLALPGHMTIAHALWTRARPPRAEISTSA